MNLGRLTLLGLACFGFLFPVTKEGVEVAPSLVVDGQVLTLHRAALRRAIGFKIYLGALYVKKPPSSARDLIDGEDPVVLRMHYAYMPIPHGLLVDGINKHFNKALGEGRGGFKPEFARYVAGYDRALSVGDLVEVVWNPRVGISLVMAGRTNVTVPGLPFKKVLYTTWFGDNAPDLSFRRDLLGM